MTDRVRDTSAGGVVRIAALGGVLGPVLFSIGVVVGGALYDGYSHLGQKISELGGEGAEFAIVQNLNFLVLGLLVTGFAWALGRTIGPPYLGPALIGYFGLVAVAHAWIPCDFGCQGRTTVGLIHNLTGLSGFIASIVGMSLLARRFRRDPTWRSHAGFTRGAVMVARLGLVWFVITQAADLQSVAGVAQRTFAGALLLWIAVTAWSLVRHLDEEEPLGVVGTRATAR